MEAKTEQTKRTLIVDADLIEQLDAVPMPPYVGKSAADRAEYAIHCFLEWLKHSTPASTR